MPEDNWEHRSDNMKCKTCMWFVNKKVFRKTANAEQETISPIGRCRKNAPTNNGYPIVFESDWCGQHRLDENKLVVS